MNDIIITNHNNIKEIFREVISEEAYKFANWFNSKLIDQDKTLTRKQDEFEYLKFIFDIAINLFTILIFGGGVLTVIVFSCLKITRYFEQSNY